MTHTVYLAHDNVTGWDLLNIMDYENATISVSAMS